MKKIAKVVSSCKDCPHFIKACSFSNNNNNKTDIAICGFESDGEDGNPINRENFLLLYVPQDTVSHYAFDIPKNCPLETYTNESST